MIQPGSLGRDPPEETSQEFLRLWPSGRGEAYGMSGCWKIGRTVSIHRDAGMVLQGALVSCPFGFALGIAQWWVLRGWVQRAGLWVLATTLGWTIGGTTNNVALAAIVAGGMNGLTLVYLLQNPSNTAAPEQKDAVNGTTQHNGS